MCFLIFFFNIGMIGVFLLISYLLIIQNCQRRAEVQITHTSSNKIRRKVVQAPGPHPWPIIGNLDIVGRYNNPFEGFGILANRYGDIYTLTLGHTRCLVVNNLELIKEVLNKNGKVFGGRPDFLRYHKLFGGDRNNSLALCDWSPLQQKRRNLARRHCSPRESSSHFAKLSRIGCNEITNLMKDLKKNITPGKAFNLKPIILKACANMFSQYMCSIRFEYNDKDFLEVVKYFDEIFWEINQGYLLDFLPGLIPFYINHTKKICNWSSTIRKFILERIINQRELIFDFDEPDNDFTDVLLKSLQEDKNVSRNTIIFMLEDFLGGHSAVGNLVMLSLAYIAKDPSIGIKIQLEVDGISQNGQRSINLYDMNKMPYTMSTIFEVLRYSSSPIVPHVATEDIQISGFGVTSGSIVFINNYLLNMSNKLWRTPEIFDPERFLDSDASCEAISVISHGKRRCSDESDSGIEFDKESKEKYSVNQPSFITKQLEIRKNTQKKMQLKKNIPHFLPFSIGKRTCIGQNLVRGFGFILLANIMQRYNITSDDLSAIKIVPASVALPTICFPLILTPRGKKL